MKPSVMNNTNVDSYIEFNKTIIDFVKNPDAFMNVMEQVQLYRNKLSEETADLVQAKAAAEEAMELCEKAQAEFDEKKADFEQDYQSKLDDLEKREKEVSENYSDLRSLQKELDERSEELNDWEDELKNREEAVRIREQELDRNAKVLEQERKQFDVKVQRTKETWNA